MLKVETGNPLRCNFRIERCPVSTGLKVSFPKFKSEGIRQIVAKPERVCESKRVEG